MVYLVRKTRVVGDWGKMEDAARGFSDFWKKQPETRGMEVWSNIAGRQDEYRFVAKFDSLADEEKFAKRLWDDKAYEGVMTKFVEVFALEEDQLVRTME
jgi:hypothetical protein